MISFLTELSQHVLAFGIPLEDTLFVLPNRRAQRMLLKTLAEEAGHPVFSPKVCSIDEFVGELSPLQKISKMELWVKLFVCYRQMRPEVPVDFDDIQTWAPSFLKDISEIDMQMEDGQSLFRDLAAAKTFEIPFGQDDVSAGQQEKMDLYNMLADLYVQFRQQLVGEGVGYDGLIYRDCAEKMDAYRDRLTHKHYIFAGFHVLTPSELEIVHYVKEHFDTRFYFDVDSFYCDFNRESRFTTAHFLSKICEKMDLPKEKILFTHSHFADQPKRVRIVGADQTMNQLYCAVEFLEQIKAEQGNLDNTALVLADESLLLPLLTTYDMSEANVTMGYPLSATPVYALMENLLVAYQTSRRYMIQNGGQMVWHYADVAAVFRNVCVQRYLFDDETEYQQMMENLENYQHTALYPVGEFREGLLPSFTADESGVLPALIDYFEWILSRTDHPRDRAMTGLLLDCLRQVGSLLAPLAGVAPLPFHLVRFAIHQQAEALTLALRGDATKGLQVMGLLETRTLDFKNVIMLSVNEGVLPAGISFNSLIPFDFKFAGESLENYLYKDQVYAYHFFRLLQRAENVVLVYDQNGDSLSEKSRFISQLEFEVREQHLDNIQLEYPSVALPLHLSEPETIVVQKDKPIMDTLAQFQFSASALNVFINCPLQFYLKHLCNIQRTDIFTNRMESNLIGSVVHRLFEDVFNKIKDEPERASEFFDKAIQEVDVQIRHLLVEDEKFRNMYKLRFKEKDLEHGRVYLAVQMIRNDVLNYLKMAKEEWTKTKISILGNELKLSFSLPLAPEGPSLILKGTIDRLQMEDGQLVILDYKTGKVHEDKLKVALNELEDDFKNPDYAQFVQLAFYAMLCRHSDHEVLNKVPDRNRLQCGIISIRDANRHEDCLHKAEVCATRDGKKLVGLDSLLTEDTLQQLETALTAVLAKVMDSKQPFTQASDPKRCLYCDYKHICNR
ncbi:MAG: PD-(D/E)XK nuclease family protein [Bacteroidales bacterium]|nr:PD-(D/E)XK nuclease family protein [Bacteroidales bacterium]